MKRRAFLGFLGGAAVAGPTAAKSAADMAIADLAVADLAVGNVAFPSMGASLDGAAGGMNAATSSNIGWATERLRKLVGASDAEQRQKFRDFYVATLDPNIASCRSLSLTTRIRVSKRIQFDRQNEDRRTYLQGIIDGLWE